MSLMGLLPHNATVSGKAVFNRTDLLALSQSELNRVRGKDIAMVFQDPMTSLNPHLTVSAQMSLVARRHLGKSKRDALAECRLMLEAVRIPEVAKRMTQYPHELSGGMRQRVMIATALLCKPKLLIADEPTTALDVTVQAQILQLMRELQTDFATAVLLITHDMVKTPFGKDYTNYEDDRVRYDAHFLIILIMSLQLSTRPYVQTRTRSIFAPTATLGPVRTSIQRRLRSPCTSPDRLQSLA